MSDIKDAELGSLHQVVLQIEAMVANHAVGQGMANVLHRMLSEAQARIGTIQQEQKQEQIEKEEKSVRELAVAYQVQREAALNAAERVQYESFLKKDFFAREDFAGLESFYQNSYDKLTDGGKAEMSTRVWEGVRRKEYEFIDLPDIVKEKEAQRLRDSLSGKVLDSHLHRIPASDRDEFVRAWDEGNRNASYQVLNRQSFGANVSLSAKTVLADDCKVVGKPLASAVLTEESRARDATKDQSGKDRETLDVRLDDVLLVSDEGAKIDAPLPGGKARSLVKGG